MNKIKGIFKRALCVLTMFVLVVGCADDAVIDTSTVITDRNWSYLKKVRIPVKIEDERKAYDVYMNLRHSSNYRYSNIFVLIHQSGPTLKKITERKEFPLAYSDGEWLGSGVGNLYSYQLLFKKNYRFPAKGTYVFEFEQNMRDNPLREVSDIGLRIAPSKPSE